MTELIKLITPCLAIIVLGFLEWQALNHGVDGTLFTVVMTFIGGLAGFIVKDVVSKK